MLADQHAAAGVWSPVQQINVGSTGIWADLVEHEGVLHSSYRSFTDSGYCIATRAFDVAREQFVQQGDTRALPALGAILTNSNACVTAVDQQGHRYVMAILGADAVGQGKLVVAHAAARSDDWATIELSEDPPQRGGNYDPCNLALAAGPGNQMLAFYSKQDEQFAVLHLQVLDAGRVVGAERVVDRSVPGTFQRLCGVRQSLRRVGVQLVVSGNCERAVGGDQAVPASQVRVYGLLR